MNSLRGYVINATWPHDGFPGQGTIQLSLAARAFRGIVAAAKRA